MQEARKSITDVEKILNERAITTLLQKLFLRESQMVKCLFFHSDGTFDKLRFTLHSEKGNATRVMVYDFKTGYYVDYGAFAHYGNYVLILSRYDGWLHVDRINLEDLVLTT